MPRLSIIILADDDTTILEEGLVSVLQHRPLDSEVIVLLASSYDDPYGLRDEGVRFLVAADATPLERLERGLSIAMGEVLHVLSAGAEVEAGWCDVALERFDEPRVVAVAPLIVEPDAATRVGSAGWHWNAGGRLSTHLRRAAIERLTTQPQPVSSPCSTACFLRAEALENGPPPWSAGIADRELALLAWSLGRAARGEVILCEPRSQVRLATLPRVDLSPLEQVRVMEQLYWQHGPRGWGSALLHAVVLIGSLVQGAVRREGMATLQARLQGAWQAWRPRRSAPPRVARPAPAPAPTAEPIASLRLDAAQSRLRRKHPAPASRPLRRSA